MVVESMRHEAILGIGAIRDDGLIDYLNSQLRWKGNFYPLHQVRGPNGIATLGSDLPEIEAALIEQIVMNSDHVFS